MQRFDQQLQRLRTHRGLMQVQLAVKTGLVRVYAAKLEQGEHRPDAGDVGAMHLAASPASRHEGNVGQAPAEA